MNKKKDNGGLVNETSADIIQAYPQRFGHFVSLPLPDIDGSLAEIDLHPVLWRP
jgi:aminocarboxymuconate-semialdehyde decarboxylase